MAMTTGVCGESDLGHSAVLQAVLQLQLVHPGGAQRPDPERRSQVRPQLAQLDTEVTASSPVHARQVSPEVTSSVGGGDLDGVDHHRITLERRARTHVKGLKPSCSSPASLPEAHLQEPGDVPLVVDAHGHHVLKHPEERPVLPFFGLGFAQQPVELKEQPPGAFWTPETPPEPQNLLWSQRKHSR